MNLSALKEQIRFAFDDVVVPAPEELPADVRSFAGGKHWATLPTVGLFLHRRALEELSATALVAYIAAYMTGGLVDGPYEIDLLRAAMTALERDEVGRWTDAQRAAIAHFRAYAAQKLEEIGIRNYARMRAVKPAVRRT